MSSKYVMANIMMPIEIKPDNTIVTLDNFSRIEVVSIINSISCLNTCKSQISIIEQANKLFQEELNQQNETVNIENKDDNIQEIQEKKTEIFEEKYQEEDIIKENIEDTKPNEEIQLFIRPEEIVKKTSHFKKNSSFKKRNFNPRVTLKNRSVI